jgi:hypothetical protein
MAGIRKLPNKRNPFATGVFDNVTFSIAAEGSNTIIASVQLKRGLTDIAKRAFCHMYLSDDANGDSIIAVAVTALAAGTDGMYQALVAAKSGFFTSEADGDIDVSINYTGGAKTVYLVVVLPNGELMVSSAIVFA